MRILHVLGKLDRGGVETWLVQVLRHIDRAEIPDGLSSYTPLRPGAYDEEVRSLGARIIPCLGYTNPIATHVNFRRILREHGPYDVVHSHVHHFSGYVLMLAKMGGVPSANCAQPQRHTAGRIIGRRAAQGLSVWHAVTDRHMCDRRSGCQYRSRQRLVCRALAHVVRMETPTLGHRLIEIR